MELAFLIYLEEARGYEFGDLLVGFRIRKSISLVVPWRNVFSAMRKKIEHGSRRR